MRVLEIMDAIRAKLKDDDELSNVFPEVLLVTSAEAIDPENNHLPKPALYLICPEMDERTTLSNRGGHSDLQLQIVALVPRPASTFGPDSSVVLNHFVAVEAVFKCLQQNEGAVLDEGGLLIGQLDVGSEFKANRPVLHDLHFNEVLIEVGFTTSDYHLEERTMLHE